MAKAPSKAPSNAPSNAPADERAWALFQAIMTTDEDKAHPEPIYAELHAPGEQFRMPDGSVIVLLEP